MNNSEQIGELRMKKLGFGMMRLPTLDVNKSANVDVEQVKKMVDIFMELIFSLTQN